MEWLQLTLSCEQAQADAWSDALTDCGAVAITLEKGDAAAVYEVDPSHKPLWDHIQLVALFTCDTDPGSIKQQLETQINFANAKWQIIAEDDWVNKWHEYAKPMQFVNNLWICPSWCAIPDPNAINIILDPEMAFGTGSHPTTALCLDWVARNVQPGMQVIDYGCGSGILAIAAAKFGAKPIYAVDIDPVALDVTRVNAEKNAVDASVLHVSMPEQLPSTKVDVVLANILAKPLQDLAPTLAALLKPGGHIVLSGILAEQAASVQQHYAPWFGDFSVTQQDEWVRVCGRLI